MMKIGVIGAGWYGCHIARALKKLGHEVVIYEKNADIFSQVSGRLGIRLHTGLHYPRSAKTRESCHQDFQQFMDTYPELIVEHDYSVYAVGDRDADHHASKVDASTFQSVCDELKNTRAINTEDAGYKHLLGAWDVYEPSIAVGDVVRETFRAYLANEQIDVRRQCQVIKTERTGAGILIYHSQSRIPDPFDYVIDATGYQLASPTDFPFEMEIAYQPCLALTYRDKQATTRPFSFIVMDGWFPCMMPYCGSTDDLAQTARVNRQYILTHGKWTIMGSYNTAREAHHVLSELNDSFITSHIKPPSEHDMNRFWPEFKTRFQYTGWYGAVLAKLKTNTEFRSAVTFEKDRLIHIIPGKVSNIFAAEKEVLALLTRENVLQKNGFSYIKQGVLDNAYQEITHIPEANELNTCRLQTYDEITTAALPSKTPSFLSQFSFLKNDSQGLAKQIQNIFPPCMFG